MLTTTSHARNDPPGVTGAETQPALRPGHSEVSTIKGKLLARNSFINLAGQTAPLVAALFSIPTIITSLGPDRFGILSLIWMFIGYFGFFDFGLGRAVTKLVSEKIAKSADDEVPKLFGTALLVMASFGMLAAVLTVILSPWLVDTVLNIPAEFRQETTRSLYILAVALPFVITTAGLQGLLEAYQRFGVINLLRIPYGISSYISPLLVLPFSKSLEAIVTVLVFFRLALCIGQLWACLAVVPGLKRNLAVTVRYLSPLLRFGGWLTVSNVVGPILRSADRFVVGSILTVASVTYYTTPYDVVMKLLIVPSAFIGVFFPEFGASFAANAGTIRSLYHKSLKYVLLTVGPLSLLAVILARPAISLWIGPDFAAESFRVAQFLAVGVFINSLGLVSQTLVQASGRPDLTAKLQLLELPIYVSYLLYLVHQYGIHGAAVAWVIRVMLSTTALALIAQKTLAHHSNPPPQRNHKINLG